MSGCLREPQTIRLCRVVNVASMVSVVLWEQLAYLRDAGFDLTIVADANPEFAEAASRLGIRAVGIPMRRAPSPRYDLASLRAMTSFIQSQRFDVVHSVEPKAGLLAMLSAAVARVPVRMHTYTGQVWVELTGWWREAARAGDWTIGHTGTQLLADSRSGVEFLVSQGIVERRKIAVLGSGSISGIDLARFRPGRGDADAIACRSSLGISPDAKMILFVGRVVEDKGIGELVDAFDEIAASDPDVHLVVVGPLEPERAPLPQALLLRLTGTSRVHFTGRQDPVPFFRASDLFCLPSYREGFPTVVLEAAACGVPTVASDIIGNVDAVVNGTTGVLVPVKSSRHLADALRLLLQDRDMRRRLGDAALDRVRHEFDSRRVNASLAETYLAAVERQTDRIAARNAAVR